MLKRKHITAQKKVEILKEHLENKISVGDLAERYEVSPGMIYGWKKQLFESALGIFSTSQSSRTNEKKLKALEGKLQQRDHLISEIVSENILLKKNLNGES